ncbi:hypothetical protein GCM10010521_40620 [Streptomyces rameus]|uniref:acetyl-CoA C-acetyltransferase n=1 Tax=Streptomyces rameus TaxID=68261 RepID=A0ABP6NHV5_9ACTN
MNPVYIVDAVRTPIGRCNGALSAVRPDDLFDPAVLDPQGGAIALGHPLGASGARLAGTVAHQLDRRGSGTGVAALCIGVGQGLALVPER